MLSSVHIPISSHAFFCRYLLCAFYRYLFCAFFRIIHIVDSLNCDFLMKKLRKAQPLKMNGLYFLYLDTSLVCFLTWDICTHFFFPNIHENFPPSLFQIQEIKPDGNSYSQQCHSFRISPYQEYLSLFLVYKLSH